MKWGDKMRVQVAISDEAVEKIDMYAKKMGVSRSALCSVLIGQGLMSYDKTMAVADSIGSELSQFLGSQAGKSCRKPKD